MSFVLVAERKCLASITAARWANGKDVEVVYTDDTPVISEMYGVVKYPTLLRIDEYGVLGARLSGYNERFYDEEYTNRGE